MKTTQMDLTGNLIHPFHFQKCDYRILVLREPFCEIFADFLDCEHCAYQQHLEESP
jgi:hypothetical protein